MKLNLLIGISALLLSPAFSSPLLSRNGASCKDVTFNVTGTAENRYLGNVNFSNPNEVVADIMNNAFSLVPVSGSQLIKGTYCLPVVKNSNNDKLQILFHGITGNRDYWSALGGTSLGFPTYKPEKYSWVDVAHFFGYPTLALDRLGNGASSHPDPLLVVQGPYEYAIYHDLVTQVRAGNGVLPRKFDNLIYVGHSYGSVIGNNIAHLFPKDFNQIILTGFTKSVLPSFPGVSLQTPEPAAIVNPARFGTLAPGYVTAPVEQTHTDSFFGSHAQAYYSNEASHLFWVREDVVSLGQFISTYADITGAPEYKGRVLVLTGEQDQAFCGPGSPVLGPASCGRLLPDTKSLFPNANYNWHSVNATGHAINFHYSARKAFLVAHEFLAGVQFAG